MKDFSSRIGKKQSTDTPSWPRRKQEPIKCGSRPDEPRNADWH